MLIKANTEIPVTNGTMPAYVAMPESSGPPHAAVLIMVELWGMTPHMKEVAERLADEGYAAIVCDLFRGETPPVPEDPLPKWADTFANFDDVRCTRDCRMALSWALSDESGLGVSSVFSWGFCMGGRFAHNLGAFDQRLTGIINFYGRIKFPRSNNKPFLPIEITSMIAMPYLGAFAQTDGLIPIEDVEQLKHDLSWNPANQVDVYKGCGHAFFNDHRDAYHSDAAHRAWISVLNFLQLHTKVIH